jgi:hypothetical protein
LKSLGWCSSSSESEFGSYIYITGIMEANGTPHDEEEYVLLDLDGVYGLIDIPPNANYVLRVSNFPIFSILIFNTSLLLYLNLIVSILLHQ